MTSEDVREMVTLKLGPDSEYEFEEVISITKTRIEVFVKIEGHREVLLRKTLVLNEKDILNFQQHKKS